VVQGTSDYAAEGPVIGESRTLFSPLQPEDGRYYRFQDRVSDSPGAVAQGAKSNGAHQQKTKSESK
jgi:hypothetical protein